MRQIKVGDTLLIAEKEQIDFLNKAIEMSNISNNWLIDEEYYKRLENVDIHIENETSSFLGEAWCVSYIEHNGVHSGARFIPEFMRYKDETEEEKRIRYYNIEKFCNCFFRTPRGIGKGSATNIMLDIDKKEIKKYKDGKYLTSYCLPIDAIPHSTFNLKFFTKEEIENRFEITDTYRDYIFFDIPESQIENGDLIKTNN